MGRACVVVRAPMVKPSVRTTEESARCLYLRVTAEVEVVDARPSGEEPEDIREDERLFPHGWCCRANMRPAVPPSSLFEFFCIYEISFRFQLRVTDHTAHTFPAMQRFGGARAFSVFTGRGARGAGLAFRRPNAPPMPKMRGTTGGSQGRAAGEAFSKSVLQNDFDASSRGRLRAPEGAAEQRC